MTAMFITLSGVAIAGAIAAFPACIIGYGRRVRVGCEPGHVEALHNALDGVVGPEQFLFSDFSGFMNHPTARHITSTLSFTTTLCAKLFSYER